MPIEYQTTRRTPLRGRYTISMRYAPCVVCIPARNEAEHLPSTLDALAKAFGRLPGRGSSRLGEVIIALDGCTDDSRAIINARARTFPVNIRIVDVAPHPVPHAGRVRRAAMEEGVRAFPLDEVVLFTTDADTRVHPDWLVNTLSHMNNSDFVCGDIWRDNEAGHVIRSPHEHHNQALHRLRRHIDPVAHDSDDPHPQGSGASLAMRRDTYIAIGGCPDMPSDEDVTMVRAARERGYRVRQPRDVSVLRSSRRNVRATGGPADDLFREDQDSARGQSIKLVDPRRYVAFYRHSAALRTAFAENDAETINAVAQRLQLDPLTVEEAYNTARSADAFVAQVLAEPNFTADMALDRANMLLRQAEEEIYGSRALITGAA